MKIALFTNSYSQVNGVSIHVKNIASVLTKKGHEVTVYTGSGSSNEYKVVNLPHIPFPFEKTYDLILPKKLKINADIVHSHTPFIEGWLGLLSGKPSVTTTHVLPTHFFSLYHANFLEPFGWKFLVKFHNKSNHVISQTKSTATEFRKHGVYKPISIISAGIDSKKYRKGKPKKFRDKYRIDDDFVFSMNRLSPEKRPEFILKACRELGIQAVLASSGPLKEKLEKKYPEARFLGFISEQDKIDGLAAATLYVLPSTKETEGITLLEALAAGTPSITTNIPTLADKIKDNENGFLFNNYLELKEKLQTLWNNKKLQKKFAGKGRKTVEKDDINKCVNRLLRVYERVISES